MHAEDCAGGSDDESEVESDTEELLHSLNLLTITSWLLPIHFTLL